MQALSVFVFILNCLKNLDLLGRKHTGIHKNKQNSFRNYFTHWVYLLLNGSLGIHNSLVFSVM